MMGRWHAATGPLPTAKVGDWVPWPSLSATGDIRRRDAGKIPFSIGRPAEVK